MTKVKLSALVTNLTLPVVIKIEFKNKIIIFMNNREIDKIKTIWKIYPYKKDGKKVMTVPYSKGPLG